MAWTGESANLSADTMKRSFLLLLGVLVVPAFCGSNRPNVLFIAVDDLRPQTRAYGKPWMQTPHLDSLASRGVLFERAYCMVPTCGASRAALMTSVRPARERFTSHLTWAEKDAVGKLPLHTHFKNHGYTTISLGKVFHHPEDHVEGWSERPWRSSLPDYQNESARAQAVAENQRLYPQKSRHNGPPYEMAETPESDYRDSETASRAIEYLRRFAGAPEQPFFLAVGFHKPHLPFNAPKPYWDLYDPAMIDLPDNYHAPQDAPDKAVHNSGELRAYAGIHPSDPVDRETARQLIHGYFACVSFVDAQVGRLLAALDQLELAEETIIVLWGDHGWQLGEHGMWNKHSCFETSMHAPLLVAAPGQPGVKAGTRVPALVEFIDIYPSLCELAGMPIPAHVEGRSFLPLMENPHAPWKTFAIGRFGPGDTIRTDRFRYSEYRESNGQVSGRMLYDHRLDPDENLNVASGHPREVGLLEQQLGENKGR